MNNFEGVGFCNLLFIVFLVLKLTNYITWSWWWVTAPLWGGLAIYLVLLIIWMLSIAFFNHTKRY